MASLDQTPKYLLEEESLTPENKEFISTLPRENGWILSNFYQYQRFWYTATFLQGVLSCQKHFQAQDSDVFLVTTPKSGITWLKAIVFALMNRRRNPIASEDHPLLVRNPHDLVPFLELKLYAHNPNPDLSSFPSPRLFSTHMPYVCLPESVKSRRGCKLVYLCRNPKDTFVSLWHFINRLGLPGVEESRIDEAFDKFCNGIINYGPFWDHVVEYWKKSVEDPDRVLFVKYEDMKGEPRVHLCRLAKFLNCPFTAEEEESGVVDRLLELTSFDHLSSLEVNRSGRLSSGMENKALFRRGEVGDWKNYLTQEMVEKNDEISREKFGGTGLNLIGEL